MRPGKPLMMADFGGMRLLGLPGNPVSSFVCAELFLKPLLRLLAGRSDVNTPTEAAILSRAMKANDQRADYVRGTLEQDGERLIATPFTLQDSSMMRVLAESHCLIIREPFAPAAVEGEACRIIRI